MFGFRIITLKHIKKKYYFLWANWDCYFVYSIVLINTLPTDKLAFYLLSSAEMNL